jgi:DNA-binding MarR family transcriptional regulator
MNATDNVRPLTRRVAGERKARRALAAFLTVLERIEGLRLEAWEHLGLTLQQCRVLHVIEHEMNAPVQSDLARRLGVRPATVTLHLNRLMRHGLIERLPDASDRRVRHVVLTDAGRSVLGSLMQPPFDDAVRVLGDYPGDEVEALSEMIERFNNWVSRLAEAAPNGQQAAPLASA